MSGSSNSPRADAALPAGGMAAAVQQRFVDALAARAAQRQGRARAALEARLQVLRSAAAAHAASAIPPAAPAAAAGPLSGLLAHIAATAATPDTDAATTLELKTLRYFRSTWSRLSADQRLTQSLAQVPANAGPLHSHHLVHRALTLMRSLSPEYLQHFMAYADALLWLAQVPGADKPAGDGVARAEPPKKTARQARPR